MDKYRIELLIKQLIIEIEGQQIREEITATPTRVYKAYKELFDGYDTDIPSLFTTFKGQDCIPQDGIIDQIVAIKNHQTFSTCEHHMLNFSISANVAYLPKNKVVGASKIPRLINAYAHRLQIQERITRQVADAIVKYLDPYGVAVIISGEHNCIKCRGVKSENSSFITSVMLGVFRDNPTARIEVLSLLGVTH